MEDKKQERKPDPKPWRTLSSEYISHRPWLTARRELSEESGYGGGTWRELMTISCNPSNMTNLVHCFVAEGVEPQGNAHLEATEDIVVDLLTREEVLTLLHGDSIKQALMLAPLWRYFYGEKG